ncbi:MAG TPA: hypothetical protein VIG24_11820 [Acidimicrobiia bacterium]
MTTPALAQNVKGKGRHYQAPDGELVPSITNVLGVLDKPALKFWAAGQVAERAYDMRHSLTQLEREEAVTILKQSPWRSSSRAADRGTTIHAYLETRLQGLEPREISGEAARFRKAADAFLDDWTPEPLHLEMTVFGDGYAGTGDLWAKLGNGAVAVLDYKTSKAIYPEAALQLAALARADVTPDGSLAPVVDEAWVVRIGEDGYEAKQVRDIDGCYQVFRSLLTAWHWTNDKEVYL